jgi:transcriptional regulator of acetoin/glycerol metabolism/DNA-binding winged helix-turn-helix (wHTH) protein
VSIAELQLDAHRQAAVLAGRRIDLSRREFALLELLVTNAGHALTRDRILAEVWRGESAANVVDVYINYLRGKLGDRNLIRSVRGVGYEWRPAVSAGTCSHDTNPSPVSSRAAVGWPRGTYRDVGAGNAGAVHQEQRIHSDLVDPLPGMIGDSSAMQPVYRLARRVALHNVPVLITGPTGSGKELVAQAVHALSRRASRPIVTINCAAIPDALLESELFGFTRGAFTGAVQSHLGRIHAAQGGALFLDEVGEVPLSMQAKLLRFLESGELQRLGSRDVFQMDVRVIAATNCDLARRVREGSFRDDLYYRLAVFPIALPPLAERGDDVLLLARDFLDRWAPGLSLTPAAEALLLRHDWRGNVRELRHVIDRAVILASPASTIDASHLAV